MYCAFGVVPKKSLPNLRPQKFSIVLYRCFIILVFVYNFQSVIHFSLMFYIQYRYRLKIMSLHIDIYLF